jgi:hypothetical protein
MRLLISGVLVFVTVILFVPSGFGSEPANENEPPELTQLRIDYQSRFDQVAEPLVAEYERKLSASTKQVQDWYQSELSSLLKRLLASEDVKAAAKVQEEQERLRLSHWNEIELSVKSANSSGQVRRNGDICDYWSDTTAEVSWDKIKITPGTYKIYANYSSPNSGGGGTYKIRVGGQHLKGDVLPTQSWDTYEKKLLGELKVVAVMTDVRITTISVSRDAIGLWNLRSIILQRVN